MAYMFNEDKTKFPFVRDLLWSGNEAASSVTTWTYNGDEHDVNLGDYDEFEIHTQEGAVLIFKEVGSLITNYTESALVERYVTADAELNSAIAQECFNIANGSKFNSYLIPTEFYGLKIGYTDAR